MFACQKLEKVTMHSCLHPPPKEKLYDFIIWELNKIPDSEPLGYDKKCLPDKGYLVSYLHSLNPGH